MPSEASRIISSSFVMNAVGVTDEACFLASLLIRPDFGLGLRVQASGFRVQGSGFRVQGLRVEGLGLRVQRSGFRVQGSGFRV